MRPVRDIIVKVEKAYKDTIKTNGGLILHSHNAFKEVKDTVRYGKVVAMPNECKWDVNVGDEVLFHHSVVGETLMDNGIGTIESPNLVDKKQGLYRIRVDYHWPSLYATIRDNEIIPIEGVCFVKQDVTRKYDTDIYIPNNEKDKTHVGIIVYPDAKLKEQGVDSGTKVVFERDSEYEFNIGDEKLYRMFTRWIVAEYED